MLSELQNELEEMTTRSGYKKDDTSFYDLQVNYTHEQQNVVVNQDSTLPESISLGKNNN